MIPINGDLLRAVMPRVGGKKATRQKKIVDVVGVVLQSTLKKYKIETALRIAHFIAQVAHESDGFSTTEEYASGANYEGRASLGNTEPGDGVRFKGRGLIQLTGRANYRRIGKRIKKDLENNPQLASDPAISLQIACEYWTSWGSRGISPLADRDDLRAVTRAINGGYNGLHDRRRYLGRAKTAIAKIIGEKMPIGDRPTLRRGMKDADVAFLQDLLQKAGYPVAIDGDFGPATETIVRDFQQKKNLVADGIVGRKTWEALAPEKNMSPVLQRGIDSNEVAMLQELLKKKGYKIVADGNFGPATEKAVKQFQDCNGLKDDGIVRARMWELLRT